MATLQRIIRRLAPARWARSMEAESRLWMLRCACGDERSIWDLGGIRWKAVGNSRHYLNCPACGKRSWQQLSKHAAPPAH